MHVTVFDEAQRSRPRLGFKISRREKRLRAGSSLIFKSQRSAIFRAMAVFPASANHFLTLPTKSHTMMRLHFLYSGVLIYKDLGIIFIPSSSLPSPLTPPIPPSPGSQTTLGVLISVRLCQRPRTLDTRRTEDVISSLR